MKRILTFLMLLVASTAMTLAQDTWTVAGTAAALNGTADWAPTNAENDMTLDEGTVYTLTVTGCTLEKGVTYQYKVVKNHSWDEAYPPQNKTFTVKETAVYTVVYNFDADSKTVSEDLTKTGEAGEVTHTYSVAGSPATVFGAAWSETSTATDMQQGTDGLYWWKANGVELAANTKVEFKVVVDHSWGQAYPNDNFVVTIEEDAAYDLTFTFNATTKEVNCIVEKKGSAVIEYTYIVAGSSEALFGVAWDGSAEANKLEKQDDGTYAKTYANATLTAGQIKWKVVLNGNTWIPDGTDNDLIVNVPEDGTYDVIFTYNPSTQTPASKLMKDGQEVIPEPSTCEGWPANYGGVMLQGFYWNSFEDT
ncbi:MAG: hypothetical protein K6D37_02990, partial [Prevotella sp.]|nr:hypothetical protein [Prevotella sp.]